MKVKCKVCNGTGNIYACDEDDMKCRTCGGTGFVEDGKPENVAVPITFRKVLEDLYAHYEYTDKKINIHHRYTKSGNMNDMAIEIIDADGNKLTFKVTDNGVELE